MAYEFHADFTLAEAALLLANKEKADLEVQGLFRQLRNAAESGELAVTRIPIYRSVGIRRARVGEVAPPLPNVPTGETDWPNSLVARAALAAWCEARGHVPPLLVPDPPTVSRAMESDDLAGYHTPALDALRAAISRFWLHRDPRHPAKSAEIVDWLMGEHGMTRNMAQAIDRIIRPEPRRRGGNIKLP